MEWGFNSPLAHDETADPLRICGFCFPWLLHVAPLVFRAPEGPAAVCAGGRRPAREPSALRASLGASDPRVAKIPPFGDGEIVVRGSVAPKVQTTSAKNAENGLLWAKWSAF